MSKKNLILSLIQDDLVHQKLINSLGDIGLNADDYHLNLSLTILKQMGIERSMDGIEIGNYMSLATMSKYIPLDNREEFRNLALEIYNYLNTLYPRKNDSHD